MIYSLKLPTGATAASNRPSHVAHTITELEQLKTLLPRKLAKNAEALHQHITSCIRAGRESVTIQASPYICADVLTCPRERARHGACTHCGEAGYGNCDGCEKRYI
jgi:hypothetical protein